MTQETPQTTPVEFHGNPEDRVEFEKLVRSEQRTPERALALSRWREYKKARAAPQSGRSARKKATTGRKKQVVDPESPRSDVPCANFERWPTRTDVTAPGVDLRGLEVNNIVLGYVDLRGVCLDYARFGGGVESGSAMKGALFENADLRWVHMRGLRLMEANFRFANLEGANLDGADLEGANLSYANLRNASLRSANLERASLMGADLRGCSMQGARVYGASLWDVKICEDHGLREDLIVTPLFTDGLRVENLDVAQFAYTLMSAQRIAPALDSLTKKGVLILGRFTEERLEVLRAVRDALIKENYIPFLCDFEPPKSLTITETIQVLASMSHFVIVDLTKPRSAPHEVSATVSQHMVPFVPLIQEGETSFGMFTDIQAMYGTWVLPAVEYRDKEQLLDVLNKLVIEPAEKKRAELDALKRAKPERVNATAYLRKLGGG